MQLRAIKSAVFQREYRISHLHSLSLKFTLL